jgi:hypothetical protein
MAIKYFKVYWETTTGYTSHLFVETEGSENDAREEAIECIANMSRNPFRITKIERK